MASPTRDAARHVAAKSRWDVVLNPPLHAFFLPMYLVAVSASVNADETPLRDFARIAATLLAFNAVVLPSLCFILKDTHRSGILTLLIFLAFFFYGWVVPRIPGFSDWDQLLIPTWIAVFAGLLYLLIRRKGSLAFFTKALNIVTGAIVLSTLTIGSMRIAQSSNSLSLPEIPAAQLTMDRPSETKTPDHPDIYYLIFDRYGAGRTLSSIYGHDNRGFLDQLRRRGFYVAENSSANYTKPGMSLASSLNMQNLNSLSPKKGRRADWKPIFALLNDTKVWRFLKSRGYRYTHIGSWWGPTQRNVSADWNVLKSVNIFGVSLPLTDVEWFFVDRTWLSRAIDLFHPVSHHRRSYEMVASQLAGLRDTIRRRGPDFVFAHFLLPHDPYAFDAFGNYKPRKQAINFSRQRNYVDQVIYANTEIKKFVDELLTRPGHKPIIIIQADEGPYPIRYAKDRKNFDWREATDAELREKFRILNSLYLPGRSHEMLYSDISPVNTFRVIFNEYFGQRLPLLPDKSYTFATENDLYTLHDITDVVR